MVMTCELAGCSGFSFKIAAVVYTSDPVICIAPALSVFVLSLLIGYVASIAVSGGLCCLTFVERKSEELEWNKEDEE